MQSFTYTVNDEHGIHARPAGVMVSCAKGFSSDITVRLREKSADCKKLFSVMSLGAEKGDVLEITAKGSDEDSAVKSVKDAMEEAGL